MPRLRNALTVLIFIAALPVDAGTADSPTAVVEDFQSGLLQVMKEADQLAVQQRYDRLLPLIRQSYHTELMIRIVTGPFWQKASQEQQRRVHDAFTRMGVSTLATLFDGYSGETFRVLETRAGPQETTIVATHIERPQKKPVPINYITRKYNNRWYIVDILLDQDISELKVRQSEYRAVLNKNGIEGLIKTLNAKADELVPASQ